jgi:hypothetical protein
MLKYHDSCSSLNPPRKLQNKNSSHRRQIWLDCEQQSENSILAQTCLEFDREPNTIVIEYSFLFLIVIYTSQYGKRFMSYWFWSWPDDWNSCAEQTWAIWQSQKTSNTKIKDNFLQFPIITHTLKSGKQGRSYDRSNTAHKWKNLEYNFWFGLTTISQDSADRQWYRIRRNT